MSSAKAKAPEAITTMPDNVDSQQLLHRLMRVLRVQQGLIQRRFERDEHGDDSPPESLWGTLRGSVHVGGELDLTKPVIDEAWDAAQGVLHR